MNNSPAGALKVFNIPAGLSFVDALADGILDKVGSEPEALADITVLLPTRRAGRTLREAFLRQSGGRPLLLPRLLPLGDLDEEELMLSTAGGLAEEPGTPGALGLPPVLAGLRRQLLLARLILAGRDVAPDQAAALAHDLARFLDQVHTERLSFEGLSELVPAEFAEHWQTTLEFLHILTKAWPDILNHEGAVDPAARRNMVLDAQTALWTSAPPAHPVIAAGSTGSIPATADLLRVVASLPQGAVVLPGLDTRLSDEAWSSLGPHHAQYGLMKLLQHFGLGRGDVKDWPAGTDRIVQQDRNTLISQTMAPASATAEDDDPEDASFDGVERIDCPTPQDEAGVIALAMRRTLDTPGRTAALVTPDRQLARRVAAELDRWGIEVDDSAGLPLAQTPPGGFLRLTAEMLTGGLAPVPLLAALKHPFAAGGREPAAFRAHVRRLEIAALRGARPAPGLNGLRNALAGSDVAATKILDAVASTAADFLRLAANGTVSVADLLRAHVNAAESLAASDDEGGADRLWREDAGEALADFVSELLEAAPALGAIDARRYPALLDSLIAGRVVRPRYGRHPRLFIWGLMEARLQRADLMILGGLNEATWPPEAQPSPWMSRPMLDKFGLPRPERRIGLTAHDFAQAFAAPEVLLTRAERVDGTPTVPSRWLQRLENLMQRLGRPDALKPSTPWLDWLNALDEPAASRRVAPPAPTPPLAARPDTLSVTRIETWIRDPYAIYAGHVLMLRPLDPIDADPGAAERGTFVHDALDQFTALYPTDLPQDAERRLLEIGQDVLAPHLARPGVRAFWWPRFKRIARWFIEYERQRRETGILPAAWEVEGELAIAGLRRPFTVTARADRIDRQPGLGLAILDYKTGQPPTTPMVKTHLSPQLSLEAAMARRGGFKGLVAEPVAQLVYLHLSGGREPGRERVLDLDVDEVANEAVVKLTKWVQMYEDEAMPYVSQPRPMFLNRFGDFDHLARVKEWRGGRDSE